MAATMQPIARLATSADCCTHVDLVEDTTALQRQYYVDKHTSMTASKAAVSAALKELDVLLTLNQAAENNRPTKANYVVTLKNYHLDAQDHRLHMIMEHCARGDLFRVAQDESRLIQTGQLDIQRGLTTSERGQRRVIHQLLRGIQSLHDCHIAHMDISIENVLITREGDVRVADFALSQRFQPGAPSTSLMVAKRAYAAPELLVGGDNAVEDLTKVDAWAVGIILWQLLTRAPLFSAGGATMDDPMFGFIRACRESGSSAWVDYRLPSASPTLRDLLLRLLDPYPSTRISIASALKHSWFNSPKPNTLVRPAIKKISDHYQSKQSHDGIKTVGRRSRTASAEISLDATRIAIRPSLLRQT